MKAWQKYLDSLEPSLGKATVDRWLRTIHITNFDACNLYLQAQDSFQASWYQEHIASRASKEFANENGNKIKIHMTVLTSTQDRQENTLAPALEEKKSLETDALFEDYTLDNFIAIPSSKVPYTIVKSLTLPASTSNASLGQFNPLYLYGQAGCGKTHLLQGLQKALATMGRRALYVTMETFTENIVSCIRHGYIQKARDFYRSYDVLLFDNIQFLAKKLATQEEFFHTFNFLHGSGRQIVICSALPPSQLQGIEPRLVSRFEWGLTLRIDRLTGDEVLAVAKARLARLQLQIAPEDIEKALSILGKDLSKMHTFCDALALRCKRNEQLTFEVLSKLTGDLLIQSQKHPPTPQEIVSRLASYFGITSSEILSRKQNSSCSLPRQLSMYLCRFSLGMPYKKIGDFFHRDHSTVMSSIKSIEEKIKSEDSTVQQLLTQFSKDLS